MKKNKSRQSATQKERERNFLSKVSKLFDIAHDKALAIIKFEKERNFLIDQREKRKITLKKVSARLRESPDIKERASANEDATSSASLSEEETSTPDTISPINSEAEKEFVPYFAKKKTEDSQEQKVTFKKLFTPQVTSALDRN